MVLPIYQAGNPELFVRSSEVLAGEFNHVALSALIDNMRETKAYYGGVGIAAPQIGVKKRVIIIEYYQAQTRRYLNIGNCPFTIIINPSIAMLGEDYVVFDEGCLSLSNLRGEVVRPKEINYKYYDFKGRVHTGRADGFFARVLQHECDHLDGILYPMRMNELNKLYLT